ncbi:helix-turn-helix domain-containing protein [Rhodovulum marinum]|uniref:HTH cro/C1-type domain-containing protein n=1 Tax=Rhodovulum marinum TaxID=320662 RepID=A0A4V6NR28_9RHOB|nr:helix-turn-helix transcriptional regulator [Rhodovulum marinum]TCP43366.1 hypothetical protein EV662_102564 [Rhodovulum marinum]
MTDTDEPDVLVGRLAHLAFTRGLSIREMAERCGIPKSSMEGYMRVKGAKRPGVDALIAIANGMDVSIDWLVGRSADSFSPTLSQRDYALQCFRVVESLLAWLWAQQSKSESPILTGERIAGLSRSEIAANAMAAFMEGMREFASNERDAPNRSDFQKLIEQSLAKSETGK